MKGHAFANRQNRNQQWLPMTKRAAQKVGSVKLGSRKTDNHSAKTLRVLAQNKVKQGDYKGAIAFLTQLIKYHPIHAVDYNNRGLIYFQIGDNEKAIADYNRALQLNPQLDNAYNNRANYYVATGQIGKALADYEKAIDLNPGNVRTWINQAISFRDLGLYDLALENLDMALLLGGFNDRALGERGRTYHLRGDWNCAIADYQRVLNSLSSSSSSSSLRRKVETWMNELFEPLTA
ncbi:MAG TPA: hypothetical protein DEG17_21325 [Cyanobacteria bacterium UBA11149]|nr:hypothetical protein [Cyanobacteria bacterium UBA11367]HBE56532.1 hypothetical protein [Cyanobacteria bacterium UBA11366]HBK62374.1 hypothetical protein [Cyanobacteria bacterium UBA11166]HBR75679.1 hypothetical protein [Cyanobacteria bacterium UBA11159]HBS68609.1 hypothetical protein [Cyanobacteria bacterium UBA11153]HBW91330.1 hypothetical protein [Cyanobacteria bacterium UBA11149]HCA98002.1 hypothetical protein [Cyanobacteria bacterium UBA9226]